MYSDWTNEEFGRLLGYKPGSWDFKNSMLRRKIPYEAKRKMEDLPSSIDWRVHIPPVLTPVKDQGNCGSCWTFGATETVESVWALKTGVVSEFSEQQILSCTPNPNDCGGTGGCGGGTAELAFQSVMDYGGIASEWTYPYLSYQAKNFTCAFSKETPPVGKITNYTLLPHNQYEPIMQTIVDHPLAITVDASLWSDYEGGIFNGCNQSYPHLDHIVQLVGYGSESGSDYWIVRNSWNPSWGENGYIRLLRHGNNDTCGIDLWPQDGTACNGGPPNITVCGTCGILYDVSFPYIN